MKKQPREKQFFVDKMLLRIAKEIATQSKCVSYHVGAVLAKDDRIISTGYNGTPSGFINCNKKFDVLNFDREEHHTFSEMFEIHAEMNATLFGGKHGIETEDTTIYCTHQPCHDCLKHLISAGIRRIVYNKPYDKSGYTDETYQLIKESGISLEKIDENDELKLQHGDSIVAKYGFNDVLKKPFEFLYEFGHYARNGKIVVFLKGERNMQDSRAFKIEEIRPANNEDLKNIFWAIN